MFLKTIIAALSVVFLVQHLSYTYIRNQHSQINQKTPMSMQKGLLTVQELIKIEALELIDQSQIDLDLWNCINLFYGGSITPSLIYKHEFWRLFTCFFLHENFLHFFFNVVLIFAYSQNEHINKTEILMIFLPALINGNLMSALIYPDFLKIGSSLLTFSLCALSISSQLSQKEFFNSESVLNFGMILFLFFSITSGKLDNSIHFFGLAISFLFVFFRDQKKIRLFFILNAVFFVLLLCLLFRIENTVEGRFAAEIDYGCSYVYETLNSKSFLESFWIN